MAQKVMTLVSGLFQRTSIDVLDITDYAQEPTALKLVQATTSGTIHPDWVPQEATRLTIRNTNNNVVVSDVYELTVASGDVIDLGNRRVRLRTANDAVSLLNGNKGDITVTGSGSVWTINQNAVTLNKMQSIPANTVLGRTNINAGNVQTLELGHGLAIFDLKIHVRFTPRYNPLTLPYNGLLAYWTANEGVILEPNSSKVERWGSLVNGFALVQANSSARPIYSSLYKKYHAIWFPRPATVLTSSFIPPAGTAARSLLIVYFAYPRSTYNRSVVLSYGDAVNFRAYGIATHSNNSPMISVYYYGSNYRDIIPFSNANAVIFTFANRITKPYVNNMDFPAINDTLYGVLTGGTNGLRVGSGLETNTDFTGYVFEIAVWARELTPSEINDIMRQIAFKYGDLFYFML